MFVLLVCAISLQINNRFSYKATYEAPIIVKESLKSPKFTVNKQKPIIPTEEVKSAVVGRFGANSTMYRIAWCESKFRQFDTNGNILRGEINNKDVGIFQINEKYHLEQSKKLGMDIYTIKGNIAYADWLYQKQGTKPWNWSKECWDLLSET